MCGIVGYVSSKVRRSRDDAFGMVSVMLGAISHRGPDGSGIYISECGRFGLGHARLAIRDLSDAGKQPMFSTNMAGVITYNGEVYNTDEIKCSRDIRGLNGNGDTEVLVNLISLIGIDAALAEINGMFSFCYIDIANAEAFLVRDQYGKKPLFYTYHNEDWFFSSEIKSLKSVAGLDLSIDKSKIIDFMSLGYVPGVDTFYETVKSVPPGSYLKISLVDNKISLHRYFARQPIKKSTDSKSTLALLNRIEQAVNIRLVSDVPVSLFLSGGIDSSLIAMMLSNIKSDVCAYTVAFSNSQFDESNDALAVAKKLGIECKLIHIDDKQLLESCNKVTQIFDQPFSDMGAIPYYALCERVSHEGFKVALSGDGGDELFMGYRKYNYLKKLEVLTRLTNRNLSSILGRALLAQQEKIKLPGHVKLKLLKFLSLCANSSNDKNILELRSDAMFDCLSTDYKNLFIKKYLGASERSGELSLDELRIKDLESYLPDNMMVKADLVSMQFGLEVRSPLLDLNVEEGALGLSQRELVDREFGKLELRKYVTASLGKSIAFKDKKGFSPPMHEWLLGPLVGLVECMLEEFPSQLKDVFLVEKIKSSWHKARFNGLDPKQSQDFWSLIVLKTVMDRQ